MDIRRKIKILIVDDFDIVRQGLTALFKDFYDLEVVGATGNGRIAMALCAAYQPDVVLMDMLIPNMSGATATRLIHNESRTFRLLH